MPRINDPYAPLGDALVNFAKVGLFGGPSPVEQQKIALNNRYLQSQIDENAAQTSALARKAVAERGLGRIFGQALGPLGEAPLPPGGYGPMPQATREQQIQGSLPGLASSLAGMGKPGELGSVILALRGAAPDSGADALTRSFAGAGHALGENQALTLGRQDQIRSENAARNQALALSKIFATPVTTGAGAVTSFAPNDPRAARGSIYGPATETTARGRAFQALPGRQQALAVGPSESQAKGTLLGENFGGLGALPTPEQRVLGAAATSGSSTPRNYFTGDGRQGITLDGLTDAATGAPIPPGSTVFTGQVQPDSPSGLTTGALTKVQNADVALSDFGGLLQSTYQLAQKDPTLFGTAGNLRRLGQDIMQQIGNVGLVSGGSIDQTLAAAAADVQDTGLAGQVFDPNLSDIDKMATLLAYNAAKALGGQSGQGTSDRDVAQFRKIVGDPTSVFASQASFQAGLQRLDAEVTRRLNNLRSIQGKPPLPPFLGGAEAAQQAAPTAGPAPGKIRIDANGRIVQ